jgi:hypothetical protein
MRAVNFLITASIFSSLFITLALVSAASPVLRTHRSPDASPRQLPSIMIDYEPYGFDTSVVPSLHLSYGLGRPLCPC